MPEEIPRHILDRVNELEKEQQPSTSREPDNEPGVSEGSLKNHFA